MLKKILHRVQRIDRKVIYKFIPNGPTVLGTVSQGMWRGSDGCEEWRRRYWEGLVRRSMKHTRQSQSVLYCGIFYLQNTIQCTCIRYNLVLFAVFFSLMFWVSHLINQDNATAFCIIRKYLLFCKTFKLAPAKRAHCSTYQLLSQCFPLMPLYPPHWSCTDINFFVSIYMSEPGVVMDWLLWNVAVLLTIECNAAI
jgi:hypothetical protein